MNIRVSERFEQAIFNVLVRNRTKRDEKITYHQKEIIDLINNRIKLDISIIVFVSFAVGLLIGAFLL